jgi:viroplasmin and RNaseH domain-containing protein
MVKKYYAVKQGFNIGIYTKWDECKKQVEGYSGAMYKGFPTLEEAKAFLGENDKLTKSTTTDVNSVLESEAIAYVDGSYDDTLKAFSYGVVIFHNEKEHFFAEKFNTPELLDMRNVAGEIKGAEKAMQYCVDNRIKSLDLYYDYEGIAKWCIGEWNTNKDGTKAYKQYYDTVSNELKVTFIKVAAHSGNKYNDLADKLAKKALNGKEVAIDKPRIQNVYLERDNLDNLIISVGKSEWIDFTSKPIYKIGNQYRCEFSASGQNAMLDFYFRNDDSTTIRVMGTNTVLSKRLKELIEGQSFKNKHDNASCTFTSICEENFTNLVNYLKAINKMEVMEDSKKDIPPHQHYKFKSKFGDTLVLNLYNTGKLLIQGKPAYIFTETLYFMSTWSDISIEDIVAQKNAVYQSNITVDEARKKT